MRFDIYIVGIMQGMDTNGPYRKRLSHLLFKSVSRSLLKKKLKITLQYVLDHSNEGYSSFAVYPEGLSIIERENLDYGTMDIHPDHEDFLQLKERSHGFDPHRRWKPHPLS